MLFNPLSEPDLGVMPGTTGAVDPSSAYPIAGSTGVVLGTGTQQHGLAPVSANGSGFKGALESFWQWLNAPFTTAMSPVDIMVLVGIIIISVIVWNFILYHIRIAAESI